MHAKFITLLITSLLLFPSCSTGGEELSNFGLSFFYDHEIFYDTTTDDFEYGRQLVFQGDGLSFIVIERDLVPEFYVDHNGYFELVPDELYEINRGELQEVPLPDYDDIDESYDLVLEGISIGNLDNYLTQPGKYYSFALSFEDRETVEEFTLSVSPPEELFFELLSSVRITADGVLNEELAPVAYCGAAAVTVLANFDVYGATTLVEIQCPEFYGEDFFRVGEVYSLVLSPLSLFPAFDKVPADQDIYWAEDILIQ